MKASELTIKKVRINSQGLILLRLLYLKPNSANLPALKVCRIHTQDTLALSFSLPVFSPTELSRYSIN